MPEEIERADVVVLGGGPGGYVAALCAARRGASVVLVEKERVGGTCLNVGCIPTKALTTSAELLLRARRAREFGLSIPRVAVDLPALMEFKRTTVDQLVGGVELLLRARRVTLMKGAARLLSPTVLSVNENGGPRTVSARHVILAPGSIPAEPPIEGRDLPGVMTSTQALAIDSVPARFVVVGGGVIGLEFACIYEALGSQVTVLEMAPTVLAGVTDEAIAERLRVLLRRRGMTVETNTTVQRIARNGDALEVQATGPSGPSAFQADGRRVRPPPGGQEHAGALDDGLAALARRVDSQGAPSARDAVHGPARLDDDAPPPEKQREPSRDDLVRGTGEHRRSHLEHGDVTAQRLVDAGELEPDHPGADDHEPSGDRLDLQRLRAGHDPGEIAPLDRRIGGHRSGREDDVVGGEDRRTIRSFDVDGVGPLEPRHAAEKRDVTRPQEQLHTRDELVDGGALVLHEARQVRCSLRDRDPELARPPGLKQQLRGGRPRLGGNAAHVETGPADPLLLHEDDSRAALRCT